MNIRCGHRKPEIVPMDTNPGKTCKEIRSLCSLPCANPSMNRSVATRSIIGVTSSIRVRASVFGHRTMPRVRSSTTPVDARDLPRPENTQRRLVYLAAWYDTSIDWNDPPDPSPWDEAERQRFNTEAQEWLATLREQ